MTFAEYLKQKRLEKGLTQKQVAELCGLAVSQVQDYETGRRKTPAFLTVVKLARAVGFSLDDCAETIDC